MHNPHRTIGRGILALVILMALFYLWPYLVAFLALVGAGRLLQLWRQRP